MKVDQEKVKYKFQIWADLVDLGYETSLAGIRHQFPEDDPALKYGERWKHWQDDHLKASVQYLEVLSRAR